MSSGLSLLNVMNMAADLLDEEPMGDPDDNTKLGRLLRRWHGIVRDQLLQRYAFSFASSRATLTRVSDPAFGWGRAYALPAGFLRPHPLQLEGKFEYPPLAYAIENDGADNLLLLTNDTSAINLRYIRRVTNTGVWSPLFCMAHASKSAMLAAQNVTGKTSYFDRAKTLYADAIDEALRGEALDSTPERPIADEWDNARTLPAGTFV